MGEAVEAVKKRSDGLSVMRLFPNGVRHPKPSSVSTKRKTSEVATGKARASRELGYFLAVLAVVIGGAMLRQVNLLYVVAGLLVGPILINWRLVHVSLRGLSLQRKVPREVCADDLLVVQLRLSNLRRRLHGWGLTVEDPIRRSGNEMARAVVSFPYLECGTVEEGIYRGRLVDRGAYEIGPAVVRSRFPFGLLECSKSLGQEDELLVFPRLGKLSTGWLSRQLEAFEGSQRHLGRQSRIEGEFFGVRNWRDGDTCRAIHARSSARRAAPVVRQFEQTYNRDVALLIDLWSPRVDQNGSLPDSHPDAPRIETAISFAATVVADLCRRGGAKLWVATTHDPEKMHAGLSSAGLMQEVMRELALVQTHPEDRLDRAFCQMADRIEPGIDFIVVGPRRIDLHDSERLPSFSKNASRRAVARSVRTVDTSDESLDRIFRVTREE